MGLFGLGKKKGDEKRFSSAPSQLSQAERIDIPTLPEFPSLDEDVAEFPKYEPTVADIKKEVSKSGDEDLVIPSRAQDFSNKTMISTTLSKSSESFSQSAPSAMTEKKTYGGEDKAIFVKIDNYKQAIHTLDALKAKLEDAEEILRAFEDVKSQEEEKLESWRKDLQNIKDKLFSIDKELFEV